MKFHGIFLRYWRILEKVVHFVLGIAYISLRMKKKSENEKSKNEKSENEKIS